MAQTIPQPKKTKSAPRHQWMILGGFSAVCLIAVFGWMIVDGLTFRPTGEIAYECDSLRSNQNYSYTDICIMSLASGSRRTLIGLPNNSLSSPMWAPDGQKLAFIGNQSLYTINHDGTGLQTIVKYNEDLFPNYVFGWSKNNQLLVSITESGKRNLSLVNLNSVELSVLRIADGEHNGDLFRPTWHPNGEDIFYWQKTPLGDYEVVKLSTSTMVSETLDMYCLEMDFSPNGETVLCNGLREIEVFEIATKKKSSIWNWLGVLTGDGNQQAVYSPDGQYIVYRRTYWPRFMGNKNGELWIMRADGSHPVKLTNGPGDRNPAWRPQP